MIKTYVKAHYNNAEDLYHDLEWLTDGCDVVNIVDGDSSVTVIYYPRPAPGKEGK